jgi:hypothetical protein
VHPDIRASWLITTSLCFPYCPAGKQLVPGVYLSSRTTLLPEEAPPAQQPSPQAALASLTISSPQQPSSPSSTRHRSPSSPARSPARACVKQRSPSTTATAASLLNATLSSTAGSSSAAAGSTRRSPGSPKSPAFDVYGQPRLAPVAQPQQEAQLDLNDKFLQVGAGWLLLLY